MKPLISVVVCTYNGKALVKSCLDSILRQKFKNFEVICVDGMSSDGTQDVIKDYIKKDKRIKMIINKKRLPEGKGFGKWQGFEIARGEIFGVIDQDNILQRDDFFDEVVKELKIKDTLGVLGGMKHDLSDKLVTRFVSMIGTDAFFAYRSVDFIRNFSEIRMKESNMPLTGGNCFFYSKKYLDSFGGYDQDVLVVRRLIRSGKTRLAIVDNATKHYAAESLVKLLKKKFYWGKKYDKGGFSYLPQNDEESWAFLKNLAFCGLILPNFIYSFRLYGKFKDPVAFLFPFVAFLNTIAYGINFLRN